MEKTNVKPDTIKSSGCKRKRKKRRRSPEKIKGKQVMETPKCSGIEGK